MRTDPDLSFIKSDINLDEVAPLQRTRVVSFVNCYMQRMAHFLNDFAIRAENAIIEAQQQLDRADLKLTLLEAKLGQIPDIGEPPSIPEPQIACSSLPNSLESTSLSDRSPIEKDENSSEIRAPVVEVTEPAPFQSTTQLLNKDDPVYSKYFKMLKMGVVEQAVKLKMQSEGVDPNVLDNPDGVSINSSSQSNSSQPAVLPTQDESHEEVNSVETSDDDSVASFSDSD